MYFLIHVSNAWIIIIQCLAVFVQAAGPPSSPTWQKLLTVDFCTNISTQFFHTCHGNRPIDFYHFILHSVALTLSGDYPCGFIFMHTFHLIRMKFDVVLK